MESDTWKGWDLWSWYKESTSGVATPFNGHDDFGEVAEYTLSQPGKGVRDPWFIIRNGGSSWTGKDCDDNDRQIPESVINVQAGNLAAGTAEFWILSGDPTVYAHPVAATGVTFDSQGGSPIGAQTVKLGGTASEPVAPTKDGFKFVRWTTDVAGIQPYDFNSGVTAPVTLYAQWAVAHKVTFDSTGGSAVDTQLVGDGEKASAPANPTRTGYTFAGWRTDATGGAAYDFNATPVTGDVTLYAQWTRTSHQWTIKFDLNGGAAPEGKEATKLYADQKVYDGDSLISPTQDQTNVPVLEGYEFQGWSTVRNDALAKSVLSFDENGKSLMPIDRDGTVYALWAKMGTVVKPPTPTSDSTTQSQIGAYSNTETGLNGLAMFEAVVRQPGKFPNTDFGSITEESTPWVN